MKISDLIEANEAPLDVVLPIDDIAELQEFFGIFAAVVETS